MSEVQYLYIGVDVGTGSVRAGLFTSDGHLLSHSSRDIRTWRSGEFSEQSTEDIWDGVCYVIKVEVCEFECFEVN